MKSQSLKHLRKSTYAECFSVQEHISSVANDLLMEEESKNQRRAGLEEEVAELQEDLKKEHGLSQVLQCALHGPSVCHPCASSLLPLQVQALLTEMAMVEEEIAALERKIEALRSCIYRERKHREDGGFRHEQQRRFLCGLGGRREIHRQLRHLSPVSYCEEINDDENEKSRSCSSSPSPGGECVGGQETFPGITNKLSEQLLETLISIFHKLSQGSSQLHFDSHNPGKLHAHTSCSSSTCKMPTSSSKDPTHKQDLRGAQSEAAGAGKDNRSNHGFVSFTQASIDMNRVLLCVRDIQTLRSLTRKLCTINPSSLTYKQKLAFWINIYNACIMNAFLQHGLPSSPQKLPALLNKATINVGGVILNALAIEHFLLRHSCDIEHDILNEEESLLRHAYGIEYPEPNVTFALCRGNWSSPALRVYTAEEVVNELERAKVEYLEASVSITSKKKITLPKLLHWHMKDFADDTESLVEWIYSQLPRSASLKGRMLKECLSRDPKIPLAKMVDIQPYRAEFRYLLPCPCQQDS